MKPRCSVSTTTLDGGRKQAWLRRGTRSELHSSRAFPMTRDVFASAAVNNRSSRSMDQAFVRQVKQAVEESAAVD